MAQANVKLTVDATSATRALQGVQNQTNQLQKAFGGLKTALLGIGFVAVTKNIVSTTVEYQKLEQRLKVLTATNGQYAESVELARQAQVKFGLSGTEALEAITNLQARLGTLGVSMQDMTTIFNGFNTAAILSGASTQEQVGAMRQLIQALGSGVLRGDEFNSIAEQMSAIQGPIAKQLGINVDQLREFAHQGKITKEIVIAAFREIEKEGSKALKELIKNDPSMTFKVLNNSIEMLSIELGKIFVPAVLDGVTALSALVRAVGNFINSDAGQAALILSGIALGVKGISVAYATAQIALSSLAFNLSHIGVQAIIAQQGLTGYSARLLLATKSTTALTIATGALTIAMKALPVVALAGGFVFLTKSIIRSINKQKEFNRIMTEGSVEELQGQLDKAVEKYLKLEEELERISESGNFIEKLFVENDGQKILEEAGEEIRKIVNRITEVQDEAKESLFKKDLKDLKDVNKSLKDREALLKLGTEEEREALALVQKMEDFKTKFAGMDLTELETLIKDNQELEKKIENLEKAEEAAKALDKQFEQIGKSIEDSIVSNLADAVEGTKTLAEAAVNVLNKLKRKLIEVAIQRAISGLNIGGSIGDFLKDVFKAEGGPVNRGRSYIVGERGPEMFVPNTSGTIVPNNSLAMGGGGVTNVITVNVDSSSSDVQSNDGQANQFGEALAAAIQAELINQKRAGGLLSNT